MDEREQTQGDMDMLAQARGRARVKLEFYRHLALYVCVIGGLCVLNLITSPGYLWFLWPAAGWGIGIVAHALNVFTSSSDLLQRMTARELRHQQQRLDPHKH